MSYNIIISKKLHLLLVEHGFSLTYDSKNSIRFELGNMIINIQYNQRENSYSLWVGKKNGEIIELDDQILKDFFESELKLINLSKDSFSNNVYLFFLGEGIGILSGNEIDLINLQEFNQKRSFKYTKDLLKRQSLEKVDKAWEQRNYSNVIKFLEALKDEDLSASYKKKYKIALERLNK